MHDLRGNCRNRFESENISIGFGYFHGSALQIMGAERVRLCTTFCFVNYKTMRRPKRNVVLRPNSRLKNKTLSAQMEQNKSSVSEIPLLMVQYQIVECLHVMLS
jgi:hypothetical protein